MVNISTAKRKTAARRANSQAHLRSIYPQTGLATFTLSSRHYLPARRYGLLRSRTNVWGYATDECQRLGHSNDYRYGASRTRWCGQRPLSRSQSNCGGESTFRANLAQELGAITVFDPTDESILDKIMDLTDGLGVDKALDCSGTSAAHRLMVEALRRKEQACFIGEGRISPWRPVVYDSPGYCSTWKLTL